MYSTPLSTSSIVSIVPCMCSKIIHALYRHYIGRYTVTSLPVAVPMTLLGSTYRGLSGRETKR